jgi:PAS domain S-box-containing protein
MRQTPHGEPEGWFRLVVEAAPNAMLAVDRRRSIALVNRGAETLFGYAREELLGQPVELLIPGRFRDHHPAHFEGFLADPKTRAMGAGRELFGLRKDGTEVPIEIGLSPVATPDGTFTLASIIDITERKRAEQIFRAIVEAAPNAKLVIDGARRITLVNRSAEKLFGYPREELVGELLDVLVPDGAREHHVDLVRGFFDAPKARAMGAGRELYGRRKDGTEVPLEIGLSPIEAPEGTFTLASIIDITERRQREDELRRSNAALEQFAYVASHDLQEPLRMVASYTELLGQRYQGKLDEKADKYIYYAVDGARRMQQLVADLLSFARIGSQGKPMIPVDSAAVVSAVIEVLCEPIESAAATIEVGPLPWVTADEGQLRRLFQNLIGNAIKFRGDTPPRVAIDAEQKHDLWQFSVKDNGIGIDMQYAERIFQMFQRLHGRGEYPGNGIGLSLAQRIVERHGGKIWLESEPHVGSTFFFTLPAAPGPTGEAAP